jgi:NAD(P)-dependent dehydrogenase (short-subunit alcohol dehydrogenase family)
MSKNVLPLNKSVLITGCSSGIGFAVASYLAKKGFTVFATVRKPADADRLRGLNEPNLVPVCPLDLTHPDHIPGLVDLVQSELERRGQSGLYAVINNAGSGSVAPVEMMDLDLFSRELHTRLVGPLGLLQALLPLLRQGGGRILWIATPAIIPIPYVTSIHACDFAVNCIARTLDIELRPWQIPTILIRCGGIKTESSRQTPEGIESILQHPRSSLYRGVMQKWFNEMGEFDDNRTESVKVAEVIYKALCAARPRRRYSIGHMAGLAAFMESMPQDLTDAIMKARY